MIPEKYSAMSQQEKKPALTDGSEGSEEIKKAGGDAQDPKNVGELTHYIQNMLQQMQDRSVRNLHSPPAFSPLILQVPDDVGPDNFPY